MLGWTLQDAANARLCDEYITLKAKAKAEARFTKEQATAAARRSYEEQLVAAAGPAGQRPALRYEGDEAVIRKSQRDAWEAWTAIANKLPWVKRYLKGRWF